MKNLKYILSTLFLVLMFTNCTKLDKTTIVEEGSVVPPKINQMSNIIINDNNKEEDITFTWSAADFGAQTAVNYSIYATNPLEEGIEYLLFTGITDLQYTVSKDVLNVKLAGPKEEGYMGLPEEQESSVKFFVTATIGSNAFVVKSSNIISVNIKTAIAVAPKVMLYIPGNHQGWAPANAATITENKDKPGFFEGFVDLHTDGDITTQFKFTSYPDWDHTNYGGQLSPLDTDSGASNIETESGFYYATVDTEALEATLKIMEPGLIGDFNSWADDLLMTYSYNTDRTLKGYYSELDLKAGEGFKIRFNGGWDYNLGAVGSDEPITIDSDKMELVRGGKNMTVAEDGKYSIALLFDFETYTYILKVEKL